MFNTVILDVAIGLIFIYLLLSLMCTAANEIIELLLKKRAIDLERGIRELLSVGTLQMIQHVSGRAQTFSRLAGGFTRSTGTPSIRYSALWHSHLAHPSGSIC